MACTWCHIMIVHLGNINNKVQSYCGITNSKTKVFERKMTEFVVEYLINQ